MDDPTSDFVVDPLENVNYVEECITCPKGRTGSRCESCAPGYTTDPANGGEFALCVKCFCSFMPSSSCDPVTGVCFNCTGNTEGDKCERCMAGFFRMALFEDCVNCSCNPEGSVGPSCADFSGVCECRDGVIGDKCDACEEGSTGTFPECQQCDECSDQWQKRIDLLSLQVNNTLETIGDTNVTGAVLDDILSLLRDIQALLSDSRIDLLSQDVQSLHLRLCTLINQTQDLINRGIIIENQLDSIENETELIRVQLDPIMTTLLDLQREFLNLSELVAGFEPFNATLQLRLAREVIDRSNQADRLIRNNVTSLLNDTQLTLDQYDFLLTSNDVVSTQSDIELRLAALNDRLVEIRSFIQLANELLCGATTDSCNDPCGGITCGRCGGGNCDSLVSMAGDAVNMSTQALQISQSLLANVLQEIAELEQFLSDIATLRNASLETEAFVNDTNTNAFELLRSLQDLISAVEGELNATRVDPDEIKRIENQTLALELLLNREEVCKVLRI